MSVFYIQGNIGSGKTTLIKKLQRLKNFIVFEEPVETFWKNELAKFYENPKKNSKLYYILPLYVNSNFYRKYYLYFFFIVLIFNLKFYNGLNM